MSSNYARAAGAEVRAARARKKVSQQRLADALGVTRSTVADKEAGRTSFSVDQIAQVAVALDVPLVSLLPDVTVYPVTATPAA